MPMLTKKLPKHWRILEEKSGLFDVSVDESVDYLGKPSLLLSSETASVDDPVLVEQVIDGKNWYGKRVRFSCYVKTENVAARANIYVSVQDSHGNVIVRDPMFDRSLKGTNDWTELFVVVDVPVDGRWITYGPSLWGVGKLWAAQFRVEEVSKDVPRTDNHGGSNLLPSHPANLDFSETASDCSSTSPETVAVGWDCPKDQDGHRYSVLKNAFGGDNAAVIELLPLGTSSSKPFDPNDENNRLGYFCQTFSAVPFRGSRIKFSSSLKTENVKGQAYLVLMVNSVSTRLALSTMDLEGLAGDNDWTELSQVLDVSEFAYSVTIWLQMVGSGKAYYSKVSVEAVSEDVPTTDSNHQPRNLDFTE